MFFTFFLKNAFAQIGRGSQWASGHDLPTFIALLPEALEKRYEYDAYWALRKVRPSKLSDNPNVSVIISNPGQQKEVFAIRAADEEDQDHRQGQPVMEQKDH